MCLVQTCLSLSTCEWDSRIVLTSKLKNNQNKNQQESYSHPLTPLPAFRDTSVLACRLLLVLFLSSATYVLLTQGFGWDWASGLQSSHSSSEAMVFYSVTSTPTPLCQCTLSWCFSWCVMWSQQLRHLSSLLLLSQLSLLKLPWRMSSFDIEQKSNQT